MGNRRQERRGVFWRRGRRSTSTARGGTTLHPLAALGLLPGRPLPPSGGDEQGAGRDRVHRPSRSAHGPGAAGGARAPRRSAVPQPAGGSAGPPLPAAGILEVHRTQTGSLCASVDEGQSTELRF